jgi:hypothetical protein
MTAVAVEEWVDIHRGFYRALAPVSAVGHQHVKRPTTSSPSGLQIRRDALLLRTSPTLQIPALANTDQIAHQPPETSLPRHSLIHLQAAIQI